MTQARVSAGIGLVLAGVVFLLDALAVLDLWVASGWWPVLFVVGGIVLFLRRVPEAKPTRSGSSFALLHARIAEVRERPYRGGTVTALLGHVEFDLRGATMAEAGASLSVRSLLGSVVVTVPPGWRVRIGSRLLIADLEMDLLPTADDAPSLSIGGFVMLSDLHVRTGSVVG